MKEDYNYQTEAEHRQRALVLLAKAKAREAKRKSVALKLGDKDNTILLVSPRLSRQRREKLKQRFTQRATNKLRVGESIQ